MYINGFAYLCLYHSHLNIISSFPSSLVSSSSLSMSLIETWYTPLAHTLPILLLLPPFLPQIPEIGRNVARIPIRPHVRSACVLPPPPHITFESNTARPNPAPLRSDDHNETLSLRCCCCRCYCCIETDASSLIVNAPGRTHRCQAHAALRDVWRNNRSRSTRRNMICSLQISNWQICI